MLYFKVRNFEKFQHYRDRKPPWIKLWYSLLGNREFFRLPDCTKWHLVGIFMLASQHDNCVPWDPDWISHELSAKDPVNLDLILSAGFIEHCDSNYREPRADWASRYVPNWLRDKILKRDNGCILCRSTLNLEIDHIIPISNGGKSEESNLQVLCRKCNRVKRFHPAQNIPAQMRRDALRIGSAEGETETETETETENTSSKSAQKKASQLTAIAIFGHWNKQPLLMRHRRINGQEKAIVKTLCKYSPEEICRAIERYSIIRQNRAGKYRQLYAWTLGEFLTRHDHYNIERLNAENWEDPFLGNMPINQQSSNRQAMADPPGADPCWETVTLPDGRLVAKGRKNA